MWMKERLGSNSNREVTWIIGKVLFVGLIFVLPTTAQIQKSRGQAKGHTNPAFKTPSAAEIERAIVLATGYLERACGSDGRFTYMIDISSGQQSQSYNIVRHAGAIYALGMLQYPKPDKQALDAMTRAA